MPPTHKYNPRTNTHELTWTSERDATLRTMCEAGKSYSEIAHALNTSRSAISGRAMRLRLPKLTTKQRDDRPKSWTATPRKPQQPREKRAPKPMAVRAPALAGPPAHNFATINLKRREPELTKPQLRAMLKAAVENTR